MALNPNQARQAGGKFGYGKSAAPVTKASQIPAQAIPPQIMAQALQLIQQQQAASRAQAAVTKAQSPAEKLYLHQLKVAQGILFKEQRAQIAAGKKTAAAAKKTAAQKAATARKTAAQHVAAIARGPAAASKGAAAARAAPARGRPAKPLPARAARQPTAQEATLRRLAAQAMVRPLWLMMSRLSSAERTADGPRAECLAGLPEKQERQARPRRVS
jgi:hypothetical protein